MQPPAFLSLEESAKSRRAAQTLGDQLAARAGEPAAGLAEGLCGRALLFAHLEQASPGEGHGGRAREALEAAVELSAARGRDPSLFSGLAGVGWTAVRVDAELMEAESLLELDRAIGVAGKSERVSAAFDLVVGLVGLGVYLRERQSTPGVIDLRLALADELARRAEWSEGRCRWLSQPRYAGQLLSQKYPDGWYDLGLAHGVAGIITFLADLYADTGRADLERLLQGAVDWTLTARQPPEAGSAFATALPRTGPSEPSTSRLAWCYGDAAVGFALLRAGVRVRRDDWSAVALEILLRASRRQRESTGVVDGSVCHGSAGLTQLYYRLYQATGEEAFREQGRRWWQETLERALLPGLDGFSRGQPQSSDRDTSMLTGAAGAALVLLSVAEAASAEWDRCLLLS